MGELCSTQTEVTKGTPPATCWDLIVVFATINLLWLLTAFSFLSLEQLLSSAVPSPAALESLSDFLLVLQVLSPQPHISCFLVAPNRLLTLPAQCWPLYGSASILRSVISASEQLLV